MQCKATAKSTGKRCARSAIAGGTVCRVHGGASKKAKAAAARRLEETAAEAAVTTLGLPRDISPTEALLEEVRWTAGHVAWLRDRVRELDRDELTWGTTRVKEGGDDRSTTEEATPSVWYVLYERERRHLVQVAAAALKAGVDERQVRLHEQQGALVAAVITRILDALQLTSAQRELVPQVVPAALRSIAGGTA